MSTGLAWTQAGGDILFIEVANMPGKGDLQLTGQLGDVMKESARAAYSYVRSRWSKLKLPKDFYKNMDIHVHVPEGAVPKDGPSAGIAMATAIISSLTKKPIKRNFAMTGEITLRGSGFGDWRSQRKGDCGPSGRNYRCHSAKRQCQRFD